MAGMVEWEAIIHGMDYIVRHMRSDGLPMLEEFLCQAIWVPDGSEGKVPQSVVHDDPKCLSTFNYRWAVPL